MISILVFTPLAALVALRLPLHPPELAFGLAVFCCMPTTLSSGVSLTQVTYAVCLPTGLMVHPKAQAVSRWAVGKMLSREHLFVGGRLY